MLHRSSAGVALELRRSCNETSSGRRCCDAISPGAAGVAMKHHPAAGVVMQHRHIEKIPYCEDCGVEETTYHALFTCNWAHGFWEQMKVHTGIKIPNLHPDSWPLDMIQGGKVDHFSACTILCGAWSVWSERNARRHGKQRRSIAKSIQWAIDIAVDLSQLRGCRLAGSHRMKMF